MKYISFAIPCYNSAAYMDRAVESILKGGEDVEIIIVNDGSKDDTSKIAHEYEEKYPTIVRAVDKMVDTEMRSMQVLTTQRENILKLWTVMTG